MYEFFISYSRKDANLLSPLLSVANKMGIKYFIDKEGIQGGENYFAKILEAIKQSKFILLIWTDNSADSKYVKKEVNYCINKGIKIVPIKIGKVGDSAFDLALSDLNWINTKKMNDEIAMTILSSLTENALNMPNKSEENNKKENLFGLKKLFKKDDLMSKIGLGVVRVASDVIGNRFTELGYIGSELLKNQNLIPQNLIKDINEKLKGLSE